MTARARLPFALAAVLLSLLATGCSQTTANLTDGVASMVMPARSHGYSAREKECLMRAMFFESNRSSRDGLVAVGTVVMNRLRSGKHGDTICAVVGEKNQFAPGVMTRKMNSKALPDVEAAADAVLKGERHAPVKNSMYFHTAGLKFKYKNMHYTVVAGGNAFYERRNRKGDPVVLPPEKSPIFAQPVMVAEAKLPPAPVAAPPVQLAAATLPAVPSEPTAPPQAVAVAESAPLLQETPVLVAQAGAGDPVLPLAIDGPTPSARPAGEAVAAFFPPEPAAGQNMAIVSEQVSVASGETEPVETAPAMSFNVDQDDADAIGALVAFRGRPEPDLY